jgi:hypothetical protein
MKKFLLLLIGIIFIYSTSLAENYIKDNQSSIREATPEELKSWQGDDKISILSTSIPEKSYDKFLQVITDTIKTFLNRSTKFNIYVVPINSVNWPLVGTNANYSFVGQRFNLNADQLNNFKLTGVMIPFGNNIQKGSYRDTVLLWAYQGDPKNQGAPTGKPFAQGLMQLSKADSNSAKPVFTYFKFDTTGDLTKDFSIFIQTLNINAPESDIISIFSNNQGDGQNEGRAMFMYVNAQSKLVYARFASLTLKMADGNPPNFDILLLPVLSPLTSVDSPITLNGLTLNPIHPNPMQNNASVDFSNERAGNIKLNLVDMNGVLVKTIADSQFDSGQHTLTFDASGIQNGLYILTIQSVSSNFALKINIVK